MKRLLPTLVGASTLAALCALGTSAHALGDGEFSSGHHPADLALSSAASARPDPRATFHPSELEDPAVFGTGIVLGAAGLTAIPWGIVFMAKSPDNDRPPGEPARTNTELLTGGIALTIGGALLTGAGVALIALGSEERDGGRVALMAQPGGARLVGTF